MVILTKLYCFCPKSSQYVQKAYIIINKVGESWGMASDGEWGTVQYVVEGVKVINCFHPRMLLLTPL